MADKTTAEFKCGACPQVLGAIAAGRMVMDHHGREMLWPRDLRGGAIRCDRCGHVNPLDNLAAQVAALTTFPRIEPAA